MYNGIGLETPRGSGTNGYVQRNLAYLRLSREKPNYRTEEDIKKSESTLNKAPNPEILEHERLRKVELKCFELRELMTEQNYDDDEIESKVNEYRRLLLQQMNSQASSSKTSTTTSEMVDDYGRPIARETHQIAELQRDKNERLKRAFGIGDDYVGGSALKREDELAAIAKKQKGQEETKENKKGDKIKSKVKKESGQQEKLNTNNRSREQPEVRRTSSNKDRAIDSKKAQNKKREHSISDISSDESDAEASTTSASSDSDSSTSSSSSSSSSSSASSPSPKRLSPPRHRKSRDSRADKNRQSKSLSKHESSHQQTRDRKSKDRGRHFK